MPAWMDDELEARRQQGLYRRRRALVSGQGVEIRWRQRDFVNFSSNDYLAYAGDPRLARTAARAALRYGTGAGASPLISGHLPPLRALERDLAAWEGTEAALVFPGGFVTNLGVVSTLAGAGDVIFSDAANHASLIDGCRLSKARVVIYQHNDQAHLAKLLASESKAARRRLIVSDTVFSMDGDLADLPRLDELAREHDALLIIDEAHATGVLGETGRGLTDRLAPERASADHLVKVGTLSKALGCQGGFVCGSARLVDYLVNCARPYIFSTALAPPLAAAARRAIFLVGQEPDRRRHLLALAEILRTRLREHGFDTGRSCCHLVPILVGEPAAAVELSRRLQRKGLLVPAIRPPSIPEGSSRLRISLSAAHTEEDVARLVAALKAVRQELPRP